MSGLALVSSSASPAILRPLIAFRADHADPARPPHIGLVTANIDGRRILVGISGSILRSRSRCQHFHPFCSGHPHRQRRLRLGISAHQHSRPGLRLIEAGAKGQCGGEPQQRPCCRLETDLECIAHHGHRLAETGSGQDCAFSRSTSYVRLAPEIGHCCRRPECPILAEAVEEVGAERFCATIVPVGCA